MDASIFIAQFLGTFSLIVTVGLMLHHKHYQIVIREIMSTPVLKFFAGIIPLILGTFFLLCQHSWDSGWHIFVTVISWLVFLKGASRILLPHYADVSLVKYMSKPAGYRVCTVTGLVLSLLLCYYGFIASQFMG